MTLTVSEVILLLNLGTNAYRQLKASGQPMTARQQRDINDALRGKISEGEKLIEELKDL